MLNHQKHILPIQENGSPSELSAAESDDPASSCQSDDDDPYPYEGNQGKRYRIPTECPHCSGCLKDEMNGFDLLISILAGRGHTALSTTTFLALQVLPPAKR